jgi:hypothetical protein
VDNPGLRAGFGLSGPLVDAAGFCRVASKAVTSSAIEGTSGSPIPLFFAEDG